jgi:oxygen-independent coproporphyrinogen-3 oxidase
MAWALTKTSPNRCLNSSHTQFVPMVIEIQSNGQVGVASPDVVHMMRPGLLQMAALPPLALYVHIPWCLRKCPYCDFNSHEWAPDQAQALPERAYVAAVMADLEASLPLVWGRTVHSIFIGGGTPSLFAPEVIGDLLGQIRARLKLSADCEITMEANPGTFERERFKAFRAAGVTRLSVGVQSFSDDALQRIGRVHDGAQALAAVTEAVQAFDTCNVDIMYALPGQTLAECTRDIDTALGLGVPHISLYHLTIEPNTLFAVKPPVLPEDDDAYAMLDLITERTTANGFERYEVSAYAQADHGCWHNTNYWQFGDYLGIGAGAHSKLTFAHRVTRQVRLRDPRRYMQAAMQGRALSSSTDVALGELSFEFMLNALRLRSGFDLSLYTERTGLSVSRIQAALETAQAKGLISRTGNHIAPTTLGFDFLSDLQSLFLSA